MLNTRCHKIFILVNLYLLVILIECNSDNLDYFAEGFDENKNCKNEDEIKRLRKLKDPVRCMTVSNGQDRAVQYEECKRRLTRRLVDSCLGVDVAKVYVTVFLVTLKTFRLVYRLAKCSTATIVEKQHVVLRM